MANNEVQRIYVPPGRELDVTLEEYKQMHEYMRMHLTGLSRSISLFLLFLAASLGVGITGIGEQVQPFIAPVLIVMIFYVCQVLAMILLHAKYIKSLEECLRDSEGHKILNWESNVMANTIYNLIISSPKSHSRRLISPFYLFFASLAVIIIAILIYVMFNSFNVIEQAYGCVWALAYVAFISSCLILTVLYVLTLVGSGPDIVEERLASLRGRKTP